MEILKAEFVAEFLRLCGDGFRMGWHEYNGGNLSYRIKPEEARALKDTLLSYGEWFDIGADVPSLADEYFLITGTGSHFRNIELNPEDNIGIIEIDEDGEHYRVCWGLKKSGAPTSELPAHLLSHEAKKQSTDGKNRVIYHCHTPNLMALTYVLPPDGKTFTKQLWQSLTECAVVFPKGLGFINWLLPGSTELAKETASVLRLRDAAIWAHHGLVTGAESFSGAFGIAHTIEKASAIAVKVISMGGKKQTITEENLKDLSDAFNLNLQL
ncbi:MAG: rhamnulose-1-phosphate aldolase [Clostridiales bacterium]|jgi:rhamnulose-1-phosphate aldolase|nr:rhamnulose-1-phosphate aldolase [Clostridiales bacterium]